MTNPNFTVQIWSEDSELARTLKLTPYAQHVISTLPKKAKTATRSKRKKK